MAVSYGGLCSLSRLFSGARSAHVVGGGIETAVQNGHIAELVAERRLDQVDHVLKLSLCPVVWSPCFYGDECVITVVEVVGTRGSVDSPELAFGSQSRNLLGDENLQNFTDDFTELRG